MKPKLAVLKTSPEKVLGDYQRLMHLIEYQKSISPNTDTLIKLNLPWAKYFPGCSTQPWQLKGVIKTLMDDSFSAQHIFPVENKTLRSDPLQCAQNNRCLPILNEYHLSFIPLPRVRWVKYPFKSKFLIIDKIFPEGIEIPEMFIGKNIIHLPTMKTHGHSITTGSIKCAFGGLLKEIRHYAHKYIHEVLFDLMLIQKELHPNIFTVMDGTVCGDGAGPLTIMPKIKEYIIAGSDSVAIDAIVAKMMGFDPLKIPYIKLCHEKGLGVGNPKEIEIIGDDISNVNWNFKVKKNIVIWGDQMLRKGPLQFLEKIALHSPLIFWAPLASHIYHDYLWYPTVGKKRLNDFMKTEWGKVFRQY